MEYLKELLVFFYSLIVFAAVMYVWHNFISPWRNPNEKILRNSSEWMKRHEMMKEIQSRSEEEKEKFYEEMQGIVQQNFKQMIEEEQDNLWNNSRGNYGSHD
jgi:hypothetical protein